MSETMTPPQRPVAPTQPGFGLGAGALLASALGASVVLLVALLVPFAADRPSAALPPPSVPAPAAVKLDFACPVAGKVWYADTFGADRPGGRVHKGEDVFADKGTPIVAITSGTIAKAVPADDGTLGGRRVWIAGDDGWWWYFAHLDSVAVAVGQRVGTGDPIGTLGNSGNAKKTPAHVHIEQHFGSMQGPYVSPFPVLSVLCPKKAEN